MIRQACPVGRGAEGAQPRQRKPEGVNIFPLFKPFKKML